MRSRKLAYLTSAAVIAGLGQGFDSNVALAQQVALEEIVVTARKREESLLDVPVAVTAFSFEEIDRSGAFNLEDIALQTAGLQFSDQGGVIPGRYNTAVRFRGMGTESFQASQQVGTVFMDGIYVSQGVSSLGFENVERVEIIKGPQSATFGRNTFAGAVNYVTRAPGFEYMGRVSAELAEDGTYDIAVSHEGPLLEDTLAYRISVRGYGTDGQYESETDGGELGRERTETVQGTLRFTPTENFDAQFRAFYSYDNDGPNDGIFLGGPLSDRGNGPNFHNCANGIAYICGQVPKVDYDLLTRSNTTLTPELVEIYRSPIVADTRNLIPRNKVTGVPITDSVGLKRESVRLALTMDWDLSGPLEGYTLSSLTGYSDMGASWVRDYDLTGSFNTMSQDPQKHEDISQELRLTSPQDERFRWSIGGNYFEVDYVQQGTGGTYIFDYDGVLGGGVDPLATAFFGPGPVTIFVSEFPTEGSETLAAFGSFGFDITEQLTLDFEWRYQRDKISQDDPLTPATDFEASFKNFLPRVTLSFQPTEDSTIWTTYAEGNLPGFFNADIPGLSATELAQVQDDIGNAGVFNDEEKLENFELGWKQELLDNQVYFSAVAYYMEWTNQKTRQVLPIIRDEGGPGFLSIQTNAGGSDLYGLELEGGFAIGDNWSGMFSLNYAEAEYDLFQCGQQAFLPDQDCSGNSVARYPKWSGALSTTWTDTFVGDWNYFIRTNVSYQGKAYTDPSNLAWINDYWRVGMRVGFEKENVRLEAFVTNLFDDDNYESAAFGNDYSTPAFVGFASNFGIVATPPEKRKFGVKAVYNF